MPSQVNFMAKTSEAIRNLETMESAPNYNKWIYKTIKPNLGKRILEVGCGTGNMSHYFINNEILVGIDVSGEVLNI